MSTSDERIQQRCPKSPYLQMHDKDPVAWHVWGEKALAKAEAEDKLIFLSIGYLTCHWCHVMTEESFRDHEICGLLNNDFVPIIVDREERPDLDQYFIQVCRLLLDGSSGWPLNVILTPDAVPVFACIYLPKVSQFGGPGFHDILRRYKDLWKSDREQVRQNGRQILEKIKREAAFSHGDSLQKEVLDVAVANLRNEYDAEYGGFGPEPKFVMPHRLRFLLNRYRQTNEAVLLEIVEKTCDAMRRGGIYDQLGAGFHRYSMDIFWFEPHFEKMIYDQAGLIEVYASLWKLTGKKVYAETTEDLVAYLAREMTDEQGCFVAGQDADSEGKDGRFFLWSRREIMETLGDNLGALFCRVYEVTGKGNFRLGVNGHGLNILARKKSFADWAKELVIPEQTLRQEIASSAKKLFAKRKQRQAPAKDTLVITSWNGMTISALATAGLYFDNRAWVRMAERCACFFSDQFKSKEVLSHSYLDGAGSINAFASDYVFLARGFLDLYSATLESRWLVEFINLFNICMKMFWDEEGGGLLETAAEPISASFAMKSMDERDLPSVNAVALELCGWLKLISEGPQWQNYADHLIKSLGRLVGRSPEEYPAFLTAYGRHVEPIRKVVIVGEKSASDTLALLHAARQYYAPETIVLLRAIGADEETNHPLDSMTAAMKPLNGKATAYICSNSGCYAPLTEPSKLRQEFARS